METTIEVSVGNRSSQVISHVNTTEMFALLQPNPTYTRRTLIKLLHYFPVHITYIKTVPTSSLNQFFIFLYHNSQGFISVALRGREVPEAIRIKSISND